MSEGFEDLVPRDILSKIKSNYRKEALKAIEEAEKSAYNRGVRAGRASSFELKPRDVTLKPKGDTDMKKSAAIKYIVEDLYLNLKKELSKTSLSTPNSSSQIIKVIISIFRKKNPCSLFWSSTSHTNVFKGGLRGGLLTRISQALAFIDFYFISSLSFLTLSLCVPN